MAKLGMGLFYLRDDKGNIIRKDLKEYRIKSYEFYDTHHKIFEEFVNKTLKDYNSCIILDCHSFHDDLNYTGFNEYPDICLGYNERIAPKEILKMKEIFEKNGYSVKLNNPFSRSIVPLKYLNDKRIKSFMLEVNRRVCDNEEKFLKIKKTCNEVYNYLNNL
jgi:N-formylglutamate amidohydrolase